MGLEITPSLKSSLGTLYYKEYCDQQGWAFVSLKEISSAGLKDNVIMFEKGTHKISVKVPAQAVQEILRLIKPANGNFVFDYLACKVGGKKESSGGGEEVIVANPLGLCWIKAGKGTFSGDQLDVLEKTGLQVAVFAVKDVLTSPGKVQARLDLRSAKEWLDELDDIRDQAESDDDYL